MRQHAGDRFDNEENRVDHQNDDENFSVLTSQGGYFFCFLLATSIHKVNLSSSTLTVPRAGRALSGQYIITATPTKLTTPPINSNGSGLLPSTNQPPATNLA